MQAIDSNGLRLVRSIAQKMTQFPLQIREIRGERTILITIKARQGDLKYLIGRQGETSRAIETILKHVGGKDKCRYILEISALDNVTEIRTRRRRNG